MDGGQKYSFTAVRTYCNTPLLPTPYSGAISDSLQIRNA